MESSDIPGIVFDLRKQWRAPLSTSSSVNAHRLAVGILHHIMRKTPASFLYQPWELCFQFLHSSYWKIWNTLGLHAIMARLVMLRYIAIKPHIGTTVLVGDPKPHKATKNVHVNSKKCIYWKKQWGYNAVYLQVLCMFLQYLLTVLVIYDLILILMVYLMITDSMFDVYSIFD